MTTPLRVLINDMSKEDVLHVERTLKLRWPMLFIQHVQGAAELTAALQQRNWDCMLCELTIDGLSTLTALDIAKQAEPHLAIVIISAVTDFDYTIKLLRKGANGCVHKDNISRLGLEVDRAMRESKNLRLRIEAENRLRENETLLSEMSRLAKIGGWEYDPHSAKTTWTAEIHRILGFPLEFKPTQEDSIKSVHPDDRQKLRAARTNAAEHGIPYDLEIRLVASGGKQRWVQSVCNPQIVDGKTVKLRGTFQDITERKKAESALRSLASTLSAVSGKQLFQQMGQHLSESLNVDYAFIGELLEGVHRLNVLGGFAQGQAMKLPFVYDLAHTPCERVVEQGLCVYSSGIQEMFPRDALLAEMGADSYVGVPLRDRSNKPVGLMIVMDCKPLENPKLAESLLEIFSVRATAEIERKRSGEALRQSEQRMTLLMNTLPYGVQLNNLAGDIEYANEALHRILGWEPGELIGQNIWDLSPEFESKKAMTEHFEKLAAEQNTPAPVVTRNMTKAGVPVDIEINWDYQRDHDGEITGFAAILSNVSDRKRMENQIRMLAQVVEQSPESTVITNLDAEIEYVNEAFLKQTGYDEGEVLGRNMRFLQSGNTPSENFQALWAALNRGEPWLGELYNKRKDGSEYIDAALIAPVSQANGNITHYFAIGEDISRRKALATELENHRFHLEQLVEQRTVELKEAQQRAEAANQAKSAFLANMSHEIRTPMNAIMGFTHLLKTSDLQPQQLDRMSKIEDATEHLLSIINNILDLSKIEVGKITLEQTDFCLATIFAQVQSLLKEQIQAKGLCLEIDLDDTLNRLRGDPTRLRQALLNYAGNAVKFTERGLITLRTRKLAEQNDQVQVRFEVRDTGKGIEPGKLDQLFHAFEQGDVSTTREYGGTGLGLVITKNLAELMGGEVGVESRLDLGSTFWFTAWFGKAESLSAIAETSTELRLSRKNTDPASSGVSKSTD